MNIFWHELKAYRRSTIVWTLALILVMVLFLSMFPGISSDASQFKKLLEHYPVPVRKALGVSVDSVTSFLGFYSYIFGYIVLCGSIQAMNLGISIISKEVREKTADFLLSKPVTRTQILNAKLLAAFVSLMITNLIYLVSASLMATIVSNESFSGKTFILISLTALLTEWMFLSIGIFLSVIIPKIKSVVSLSLSLVFGFFIISMFSSVIGEKAIRYITPFKYYDTAYILKHSAYEMPFVILEIVLILAAILASYMIYLKKDIHAV